MDIGEIICNSIDTIVQKRLEGLQFDTTKICSIVDDSNRSQGEYVVSDNSGKFKAYSNSKSYKKGNNVLVKIPNNDYSLKKTIEGLYNFTSYQPFNYEPPLNKMTIIDNTGIFNSQETFGLIANNYHIDTNGELTKGASYVEMLNIQGDDLLSAGYTRLGLRASFKSLLADYNISFGEYGIVILITTQNGINQLYLNNYDMYGNPYAFKNFFSQEKVFDISSLGEITGIRVYFYQQGNFDFDDNYEKTLVNNNYYNNLFVKDLEFYLGYEENKFSKETLLLYTNNSLNYNFAGLSDDDNITKTINLNWYIDKGNNKFELVDLNNENYSVHWYRRNTIDTVGDIGWDEVFSENISQYSFNIKRDRQYEQIKAIGIYNGNNDKDNLSIEGQQIGQGYKIESNIIVFSNENVMPDAVTINSIKGLSIQFDDNSNGNYFVYDQNGKILISGLENKDRKLLLYYNNSPLGEIDDLNIGEITWYFPVETNKTMLENFDNKISHGIDNIVLREGINYITYKKGKDNKNTDYYTFNYHVKNNYQDGRKNNKVIAVVNIDGVNCEAQADMRFGRAGSNGTDYTLCLDFLGEKVLTLGQEKQYTAQASLYDAQGEEVDIDSSLLTWEFEENDLCEGTENNNQFEIKLKDNIDDEKLSNNYNILKCNYQLPGNLVLSAYLPIPIRRNDTYKYITGATEIVYNHNGIPDYYSGPYCIYDAEKTIRNNIEWKLNYKNKTTYQGKIDNQDRFIASTFYIKDSNDQACIICEQNEEIVWSQPLLIYQNQYDLDLLNKWSGALEIEENENYIMSAMLGAGKKNNDNTFSGVLIGDVATGTGNNNFNTKTGIYGFDKGVVAYSLTEDGKATFGKAGSGQIIVDGSQSLIKSASWDLAGDDKHGIEIDLEDGTIKIKDHIAGGNEEQKTYLSIVDNSNNDLIKISGGDYFLQSSDGNTKLDLSKGIFSSKSSSGEVIISSNGNSNNFLEVNLLKDNNSIPLLNFGRNRNFIQSKSYGESKQKQIEKDGEIYLIFQYVNQNNKDFYFDYTYPTETNKDASGLLYWNQAPEPNESNKLLNNSRYCLHISENGTKTFFRLSGNQISNKIDFSLDTYYEYENSNVIDVAEDGSTSSKNVYYVIGEKNKEQYQDFLLSNSKKVYDENQSANGLQIDLDRGTIDGYNLYLRGVSDLGSFLFDSTSPIHPLSVQNSAGIPTFMVDWDGTLTCNKINSLNNDGRKQYAISVGNKFYVTSDGSAGGGTWHGSSTGVAGYSGKPITLTNGTIVYVIGK